MTPDEKWEGQRRRASQVTLKYLKEIDGKFKVPKPRVAIHARHFLENKRYFSTAIDPMKEPVYSYLERRLQEGLCFSIGFHRCPERCTAFNSSRIHKSLFSSPPILCWEYLIVKERYDFPFQNCLLSLALLFPLT